MLDQILEMAKRIDEARGEVTFSADIHAYALAYRFTAGKLHHYQAGDDHANR